MSPRRRRNNKHLPERVYVKSGSYYFVDKNNKWLKLGKTLPDAMAAWAEIVEPPRLAHTMIQLFDRYMLEIAPKKAPATYQGNQREMVNLRLAFGEMNPEDITPVHVYQYLDIRAKVAATRANREKALLSHVFSMAIRWGVVTDNPCKHVKRNTEKPRNRYIEDWEFQAVKDFAPTLISLAMDFAYLTGLRKGDVLSVKLSDLTEDGIKVTINKTGNKIMIAWSEELTHCVENINTYSANRRGEYLFRTRSGTQYTSNGFNTIWQRTIKQAKEKDIIKERFRFHDIRRKAATDAERIAGREYARQLLGHNMQSTTARYISGEVTVMPLK